MPRNDLKHSYDFSGYATKNNLRCSDGKIIRKNAFRVSDGMRVPLVWNHEHNSPDKVLGHAILENREDGVYAYCSLNDTPNGQAAKEQVKHGDITALSIWANQLRQEGSDVIHGVIREVSLVLAGANPGAFIESVIQHGEPMEDYDEEGIFYSDATITLAHSDNETGKDGEKDNPNNDDKTGKDEGEETVKDVFDTLSEKQKKAVSYIVGQAVQDAKNEGGEPNKKEEETGMKHNVFDTNQRSNYLSHSQIKQIIDDGKQMGSMRQAVKYHMEEGILAHAEGDGEGTVQVSTPTATGINTGMTTATGTQTYGFNDPSMLFPDYKSLNNPPEWISREMGWVQKVMSGVHHTPFSRIKSVYANITEEEARAKGYIKGKQKKTEVFTTLKRTTSPATIYKLQKMDRDDILDIVDFDVIAWIKAEMRMMLDEEIARAILIGDGRLTDSEDHIPEENIRPIAKDVPLFNTKVAVNVAANATSGQVASETIDQIIRSRKHYKGSGNPSFFTTEDVLTEMLLLKDTTGHRLYKTEAELATALRVKEIVTVEAMENYKVDYESQDLPLIGIIVNLADYNVGCDKGGEVNLFDDFDLDFNKYTYLIETRISGALVKPFSALTIVENKGVIGG